MTEENGTRGSFMAELIEGGKTSSGVPSVLEKSNQRTADYYHEKILGKRRPNGTKPLKKLTARHHRVIALHLTGKYSNNKIAEMLGYSAAWISTVLSDPLAQKVINDYLAGINEIELQAMAPLRNEAIRDGLQDKDPNVRLRAADVWQRHTNPDKGEHNTNINVAFVNNVRERFFGELREAAGIEEVA